MTSPAGDAYTITYTSGGLLTTFTDPVGNVNTFAYDAGSRLVQDTNAGNGGWTLARTEQSPGYMVAMTTAEGRMWKFHVEPLTTGNRRQANTSPDGTMKTKLFKTNGEETTTVPDGTVFQGPDPRFGMQAPLPSAIIVKLPSGLTSNTTMVRLAALADPADPLSFTRLTETTTVNGKAYTSTYDRATRLYTHKSPMGRVATTVINDQHRTLVRQLTDLNAVNYSTTRAAGSRRRSPGPPMAS